MATSPDSGAEELAILFDNRVTFLYLGEDDEPDPSLIVGSFRQGMLPVSLDHGEIRDTRLLDFL